MFNAISTRKSIVKIFKEPFKKHVGVAFVAHLGDDYLTDQQD